MHVQNSTGQDPNGGSGPLHTSDPQGATPYGTRVDLPTIIRVQIPQFRDSWTRAVAMSGASWTAYNTARSGSQGDGISGICSTLIQEPE